MDNVLTTNELKSKTIEEFKTVSFMSTQWGESRHFQEYKYIKKYDCKKLKGDFSMTIFIGQPDHFFSKLNFTGPIVDKKSWIFLNSCIKNTIPSKDTIRWQSKTSFTGRTFHILLYISRHLLWLVSTYQDFSHTALSLHDYPIYCSSGCEWNRGGGVHP